MLSDHSPLFKGVFSEKENELRATLNKLDSIDLEESGAALSAEDLTLLRRQLSESQSLIRETADRLRQSQEENEIAIRRREEVELRLATLETEFEELLEKTIHEEENTNAEAADAMTELKVNTYPRSLIVRVLTFSEQGKLEAQYNAKREAQASEVQDLKQQMELKTNEIRGLHSSLESLKGVNEELKVGFL